ESLSVSASHEGINVAPSPAWFQVCASSANAPKKRLAVMNSYCEGWLIRIRVSTTHNSGENFVRTFFNRSIRHVNHCKPVLPENGICIFQFFDELERFRVR